MTNELAAYSCPQCGAPQVGLKCGYCGVSSDIGLDGLQNEIREPSFVMPEVPEGMRLEYKVLCDEADKGGRIICSMTLVDSVGTAGATLLFVENTETGKPYNLNMSLDQLSAWDLITADGSSLSQELERALVNKPNYKDWDDGSERITDEENPHFGRISISHNFENSFFNQFADMRDSVQIPWQEGLSIVKRSIVTENDSNKNENWLLKGFILSVMAATVLQGENVGIPEGARLITGLALFLWLISKIADLQPETERKNTDSEGSTKYSSDDDFGRAVISRDADGGFNISRRGTLGNLRAAKRTVFKDRKRGRL